MADKAFLCYKRFFEHDLQLQLDADGTPHLFYRLKRLEIPNEEFPQEDENHIYHLNVETGSDTLFLEDQREAVLAGPGGYDAESRRMVDYVFPKKEVSPVIYSGHFCMLDCTGFVRKRGNGNKSDTSVVNLIGGYLGNGGELTLSPGRDTLYSFVSVFKGGTIILHQKDGRWIRPTKEDSVDLKYRVLSFYPSCDSLAFGTYKEQLIRIGGDGRYKVVKEYIKWEDNVDFYYGKNPSVVFYKTQNKYLDEGRWTIGNTRLFRSHKMGASGSWTRIASDSSFFAVETDRQQGRMFMSDGNRLMVSNDQGDSFTVGAVFKNRITGIYKPSGKPKTLFVSTITDIWKLVGGEKVESLRHVQVGVDESTSSPPSQFKLKQNYPNPFNQTTVIEFHLSNPSNVTLRIFDVLGKRIKTLVDERKKTGVHRVMFDAHGLSSGIYYYQLRSDESRRTRKMLLVK